MRLPSPSAHVFLTKFFSVISLLPFIIGVVILLGGCRKETHPEIVDMVYIPSGEFIIGSNDKDTHSLTKEFGAREVFFENERPRRKIFQKSFYIDKYEVTNQDYKLFVVETGDPTPSNWGNGIFAADKELHPVKNVNWFAANSYCKWAGKRLPTEEEWEKAARSKNGKVYPWGNEFDINKANLNKGNTVPVGTIPEDRSKYGVHDMAGNLKEWTSSWYKPYPGSSLKSKYFGEKFKVIRGAAGNIVGHYNLPEIFSRSSYRSFFYLNGKVEDIGFRCAKDENELLRRKRTE